MMAILETVCVPVPVPVLDPPVTVTFAVLVTVPANPCAEAVMVADPALTGVTTPEESTAATPTLDEVQVNPLVTALVVGWEPLPNVPVTVNCAVGPPTVSEAVDGATRMEANPPEVLQPVIDTAIPANKSAPKQKRLNIWVS